MVRGIRGLVGLEDMVQQRLFGTTLQQHFSDFFAPKLMAILLEAFFLAP